MNWIQKVSSCKFWLWLPLHLDCEDSCLSTSNFSWAFKKTLTILRVSKDFFGGNYVRRSIAAIFLIAEHIWFKSKKYMWRTWKSVSFSTKMPAEYNPVLPVTNYVAKNSLILQVFFAQRNPFQDFFKSGLAKLYLQVQNRTEGLLITEGVVVGK